jgi:hypothetical protein
MLLNEVGRRFRRNETRRTKHNIMRNGTEWEFAMWAKERSEEQRGGNESERNGARSSKGQSSHRTAASLGKDA